MSPGPVAPQLFGGADDRLLELLLVVGLASPSADVHAVAQRPVAHVDRIRAARHFDHRRGCAVVPKCRAKRSASSVADVMITLRSGALAAAA